MEATEFHELYAMRAAGLAVQRFTPRLLDYLATADLSISLAGYNTCMNLLATGVPAFGAALRRQREQPLRVAKLKPHLPLEVLGEDDLEPERLVRAIERGLGTQAPEHGRGAQPGGRRNRRSLFGRLGGV